MVVNKALSCAQFIEGMCHKTLLSSGLRPVEAALHLRVLTQALPEYIQMEQSALSTSSSSTLIVRINRNVRGDEIRIKLKQLADDPEGTAKSLPDLQRVQSPPKVTRAADRLPSPSSAQRLQRGQSPFDCLGQSPTLSRMSQHGVSPSLSRQKLQPGQSAFADRAQSPTISRPRQAAQSPVMSHQVHERAQSPTLSRPRASAQAQTVQDPSMSQQQETERAQSPTQTRPPPPVQSPSVSHKVMECGQSPSVSLPLQPGQSPSLSRQQQTFQSPTLSRQQSRTQPGEGLSRPPRHTPSVRRALCADLLQPSQPTVSQPTLSTGGDDGGSGESLPGEVEEVVPRVSGRKRRAL